MAADGVPVAREKLEELVRSRLAIERLDRAGERFRVGDHLLRRGLGPGLVTGEACTDHVTHPEDVIRPQITQGRCGLGNLCRSRGLARPGGASARASARADSANASVPVISVSPRVTVSFPVI